MITIGLGFIAIALLLGFNSIGKGLCELADAIRYATTMRTIEIESEPHRAMTGAYKINVRIK